MKRKYYALIVDDIKAHIEELSETLAVVNTWFQERRNYQIEVVWEVQSATNVMEYFPQKGENIDIIFMDIRLSNKGMTGIELANLICTRYKQLPIIFISQYPQMDYDVEVKETDIWVWDYVVKNPRKEQLYSAVVNTMERFKEKQKERMERSHIMLKGMKIFIDTILYIETFGSGSRIILKDKNEPIKSGYKLYELKNLLDHHPEMIQIHRSYWVNHHYIIQRSVHEVQLENAVKLPIGEKFAVNIDSFF